MIYFTSDLHFGHNQDFVYDRRGFKSMQEHDEALIANWNDVVKPEDTVYILGDIMLGDNRYGLSCLRRLAGNKNFIGGNHDTNNRIDLISFDTSLNMEWIGYAMPFKYGKLRFYLSHYPTLTSNYDEGLPLRRRVINLCGHAHTNDRFADWDKGLIYHVEPEAHNNKPVSIEEIINDLREKYNASNRV